MKTHTSKWLIVIATLVSLMFVVTTLEAGKPDRDNPNKPPKTDDPKKTKAECILFEGDLLGMAEVEGCCPNAGPFPAYTMSLDLHDANGNDYEDDYVGQLFMNFASDQGYKVQFWNWDSEIDIPGAGNFFFEIYGGDIIYDRKSKFLNVTFTNAQPTLWLYDEWDPNAGSGAIEAPVDRVSFQLVKTPDLSYCDELNP